MIRVALFCLLAGCVQPSDVACGEELICAAGTTCALSAGNHLCIRDGELHACDGKDSLAECGDGGRCYDADIGLVCLPAFCGNGYVDPGEACDDGGNLSGDGCAADCGSTEVCGNGEIDTIRGERCDDHDLASHDGCSSTCNPEEPQWIDASAGAVRPRVSHGMAFDIRRGRLVVFGGEARGPGSTLPTVDETLEWNGATWQIEKLMVAPSPRVGPAMAYDSAAGEVVLFGGADSADTWRWNGTRWQPVEAFGPSARASAAMVYDPRRKTIVMFGGSTPAGPTDETWELTGTTWKQVVTAPHPPAPQVAEAALVYDPGADRIVAISQGEAWQLAAGVWTRLPDPPSPAAVEIAHLAYDSIGKRIILVAVSAGDTTYMQYALSGTVWSSLGATPIGPRLSGELAGDPVHGVVLFYGGVIAGAPRQELWQWDGTTWSRPTERFPDVYPGAVAGNLVGAAMAHDPLHHRTLLFGGRGTAALLTLAATETWAYDGAWSLLTSVGPPQRYDAVMAADTEHDRVVLFGGVTLDSGGQPIVNGDTFLWDGATWTQGPAGPPARRLAAMAYDPKRKRVVLFGGSSSAARDATACACLDDTWEWDGGAWTQVTTSPAPAPTSGARLAYDPILGELVLFGGIDQGLTSAQTWTFDGTWHMKTPNVAPSPRAFGVFAWDAARGHLVYSAGGQAAGASINPLSDSWEWDGVANLWRRLPVSPVLQNRFDHAGAAAPDGNGIFVLGGLFAQNGGVDSAGIYFPSILRWQGTDRDETCSTRVDSDGDDLAGCADTDCWPVCQPLCPPGLTACTGPRCGDGTCGPAENQLVCPADCGMPPVSCGDLVCDPGESCAADCP